ncbi:MAG: HAD family hydrolase [Bacillota bacterium]
MVAPDRKGTILFDLDGTLLPIDIEFFLKNYLSAVGSYFKDLVDPKKMVRAIVTATQAIVDDRDPSVTNLDAFGKAFEPLIGRPWDEMWPRFMAFYRDEFPNLRRFVSSSDGARNVVERCISAGYEIVLATNPMFPQCAIRERMKWCGVLDLPWRLITSMEIMHFCKPNLEYYMEIVEMARLDPESSIMVGNDINEDMVAKRLGMKTYLVEDLVIDRGGGVEPDCRGSLQDLPDFLETLT